MSIDEQPMNVYWSGKKSSTFNKYKMDYKKLVEGLESLLNWQKTEITSSVAFYPLSVTPLDPVVAFAFTETGPVSGDKAPDNPSTITGVESVKVTRCGKNLIPYPYPDTTKTDNGITWTDNGDGTITANGTATADSYFYLVYSRNNKTQKAGLTYTISGCPSGGSSSTYCIRFGTTSYTEIGSGYTFVANSDTMDKAINLKISSGVTISNLVFRPQFELGSTATSLELYDGADYTIDLGDTFYGGEIDLATGLMTVDWWSDTLSNLTNPAVVEVLSSNVRATYATSKGHMGSGSAPTYFHSNYDNDGSIVYPRYSAGTARISIILPFTTLGLNSSTATEQTATAALASYFAEHPCVVAYKLYTPITVQLSPVSILSLAQTDKYTPRLNTVYSDAQAVQVGYAKSPIRSEYELTQAIITTEGGE